MRPEQNLFLASSGTFVTDKADAYLGGALSRASIAYIITASKGTTDTTYLNKRVNRMNELGWRYNAYDIEELSKADLQDIAHNDVVYVEGGNTFYLLKAVRKTGFDNMLAEFVHQGKLYVGSSAGAYIACPTIDMATWKHADIFRYGVTDFTALNFVPFLITAHFEEKYVPMIQQGRQHTDLEVWPLTDNQAIHVKNGWAQLVGEGDRVQLQLEGI